MTNVVNVVDWIRSYVKVLFRANDVDVLSVIDSLANERHILQTKNGEIFFNNVFLSKYMHRLKIKGTLSKDSAYECPSLQVWLDL